MIQGIQVEMSSDKLRAHIDKRVKFHADKAEWYATQVKNLRAGGVGETGHSNDPTGSLAQSERKHVEAAGFFRVLSENLIPNETYRLSQSDLTLLEFTSRYF